MASDDEPIPSGTNIKQQLDSMLASTRFRNAPNPASFLRIVAMRALQGKKTTEDILGRELFGTKFQKDESTDVRVTASNLRKTLAKYYAAEGRDDLVIITLPEPPRDKSIKLPPGEAYKPSFVYNPGHEIARKYRLGRHYQNRKSPYELADAIEQFEKVIALQPHHVAAHIGVAESSCLLAFNGWQPAAHISRAWVHAGKAVDLDPANWKAHAVEGAAALLIGQPERAETAFQKALTLDQRQTLQYGWYHAFLLAVERTEEALDLAEARAAAAVDDAYTKALYGAYLYLTREFDKARDVIKEALALDENCWFAYLVLGLVQFSCTDSAEAYLQIRFMHHSLRVAGRVFLFPGLTSLLSIASETVYEPEPETVLAAFNNLIEDAYPSHLQCALQIMSYGDVGEKATPFLWNAWGAFDPPILFLHLLPLFDKLREQEMFKMLIRLRLSYRPKWFVLLATRQPVDPG